jgi:hypothetical protein
LLIRTCSATAAILSGGEAGVLVGEADLVLLASTTGGGDKTLLLLAFRGELGAN